MISKEDASDDLSFTYKYINKLHPAFIKTAPREFEDAYLVAISQIEKNDSISVYNLYSCIQTMVAHIHDGHTRLFDRNERNHYLDMSMYGMLLSVNDIPIDKLFQEKKYLFSSETEDFSIWQFCHALTDFEMIQFMDIPWQSGIHYQFLTENGETVMHTISRDDFFANEHVQSRQISQTHTSNYFINDSIGIGYFNIQHFHFYLSNMKKAFRKEIEEFFSEVSDKKIDNIIFDVRNNTGGNPQGWYYIIEYLTNGNVNYGKSILRRGPLTFKYPLKFHCSKNSPKYSGNVYLLTSTLSYSAAMEFANCLQSHNCGFIVGESPGNTPDCYTNIIEFSLPTSRLRLQISTESHIGNRPGIVNNRIVPDYECPSEEAFDKVLEIIRAQQDSIQ